jgi:hypothetical protein
MTGHNSAGFRQKLHQAAGMLWERAGGTGHLQLLAKVTFDLEKAK